MYRIPIRDTCYYIGEMFKCCQEHVEGIDKNKMVEDGDVEICPSCGASIVLYDTIWRREVV